MEAIFTSIVILASLFAVIFLFVIVQDLWSQRHKRNNRLGLASYRNPSRVKVSISEPNRVRGYDSPELYHGDALLARTRIPKPAKEMPMPGHHPIMTLYELIASGTIPADALLKLLIEEGMVTEAEIMKKLTKQKPRRQDMLRNSKESTPKPGRKND
jgi:hypothetical protein